MEISIKPQVIFGSSVLNNNPPNADTAFVWFPGFSMEGYSGFVLDRGTFSKHLLLLGGSGCGKTNTFLFALEAMRKTMTEDDIAIIFDTKGEFYDMFHQPGDFVIGNSARFRPVSYTWNLFDEILADGWDDINYTMNARELAAALFHERGSSTQPFFCNAARDIFRGIVIHFVRMAKKDPEKWRTRLNNKDLVKAFQKFRTEDYVKIFSAYKDMNSMISYFGTGNTNQGLGVFGELNSMLSDYFIGILAEHNPSKSISMRQAVRSKGAKAIFVEYDLAVGETLSPVYRLLVDQALKEALGRSENSGQVYLIADEFKLLPKLQHIDDALNFGRGLGVRVMAGIQSIDQLYEIYGQEKGAVIAGGFGSIFAYHTNDASSREYITKRFGENIVAYEYTNVQTNRVVSNEREGNTVEDWEQMNLGVGQAVVGLGFEKPFIFQFDEYGKE